MAVLARSWSVGGGDCGGESEGGEEALASC